jgi:hypothetical protein
LPSINDLDVGLDLKFKVPIEMSGSLVSVGFVLSIELDQMISAYVPWVTRQDPSRERTVA